MLLPCTTSSSPASPARRANASSPERRDVGADSLLGEQPEHRDVRERLRAVEDAPVGPAAAPARAPAPDRLLAVDDERRAEPSASSDAATPPSASSPSSIAAESGKSSSIG